MEHYANKGIWEFQIIYGRMLLLDGWSNNELWKDAYYWLTLGVDHPNDSKKIGEDDICCLMYYMKYGDMK